jgi:serine/threonine-protein kinase
MGEVYRAKDTTLGRDVALKVLPASVANDPERLARFEREAKLLASLNHANIATLHALERLDNRHVLVMELAPGVELASRIAHGPMALDEALPIAIQICHALEAAHERGVVHRDLKPANIKVSEDGAVKVLDFGLAKALAPEDAGTTTDAMNSPTLTAQATAAGIILGTAAYMSPEQARGRTADKRADIWAFGVVLFEMVTGTRLFQGETISDTLAAVLRQDVPFASLPAGTPAELTRLLRRLLERDRRNRVHDIADARLVLEELSRGGAPDETPAPVPPRSRARWLAAAVAGILLLAIGVALGSWLPWGSSSASATGPIRLVVPMPPGVTNVWGPAASPDGRFVVFVGQAESAVPKLYLHRFDQALPRAIEGTDGAAQPFISPDAKWIAFRRANRLERISIDGGQPMPIADAATGSPSSTWLPGGGPIVYAASWLGGLSAVSPDGGAARKVTSPDTSRREIGHWFPSALPDGKHVLFTVWLKATGLDDAEVALLDVTTGQYRILFKGAEARYVSPGAIVFFRAGVYQAVRFDLESLTPSGDPVRVLDDARGNIPEGGVTHTDIAAVGVAAYLNSTFLPPSRLVWVSAGGRTEALSFPPRRYGTVSLSPDGRRAAVDVLDAGRYTMHLFDLSPPTDNQLDLPGLSWDATWHPDGKRLAFTTILKGDFDAYWKDVTSTAPATPLLATDGDDIPATFASEKEIIIGQSESDGTYPLKRMTVSPPGKPETLVPYSSERPEVSRDGKYMAYIADRRGTDEVYVLPLVGGGAPELISTRGGEAVAWSRDNTRELYYARPPEIIAVSLALEGPRLRPMGERVWARVENFRTVRSLNVGPDGRILITIPTDPITPQIRVVLGWDREIANKLGLK